MLVFGGIWNTLDYVSVIGHFKGSSISQPSGSMEDKGAEGDLNCGVLDQEVSEDSISMWPKIL